MPYFDVTFTRHSFVISSPSIVALALNTVFPCLRPLIVTASPEFNDDLLIDAISLSSIVRIIAEPSFVLIVMAFSSPTEIFKTLGRFKVAL